MRTRSELRNRSANDGYDIELRKILLQQAVEYLVPPPAKDGVLQEAHEQLRRELARARSHPGRTDDGPRAGDACTLIHKTEQADRLLQVLLQELSELLEEHHETLLGPIEDDLEIFRLLDGTGLLGASVDPTRNQSSLQASLLALEHFLRTARGRIRPDRGGPATLNWKKYGSQMRYWVGIAAELYFRHHDPIEEIPTGPTGNLFAFCRCFVELVCGKDPDELQTPLNVYVREAAKVIVDLHWLDETQRAERSLVLCWPEEARASLEKLDRRHRASLRYDLTHGPARFERVRRKPQSAQDTESKLQHR